MIFGVAFYSYTIGNMCALIDNIDAENLIMNEQLKTLKIF